jgi:hypothetical protein
MDSEGKADLVRKAELLMELRGYHEAQTRKDATAVDVSVTGDEATAVIHIVTDSPLRADGVGVRQAEAAAELTEAYDVDDVIVIGTRFTKAARQYLRDHDVEFYSRQKPLLAATPPPALYRHILDRVNALCRRTCGAIPTTEPDCHGYIDAPIECTHCSGTGNRTQGPVTYTCPVCRGAGSKAKHYACRVRLISDNADLHYERGWVEMLKGDLRTLLRLQLERPADPELTLEPPLPTTPATS